jgi:hypothetical protein
VLGEPVGSESEKMSNIFVLHIKRRLRNAICWCQLAK